MAIQSIIEAHSARKIIEKKIDDKVYRLRKSILMFWKIAQVSLLERATIYKELCSPKPRMRHFTMSQLIELTAANKAAQAQMRETDTKIIKKREADITDQKKEFVKKIKNTGSNHLDLLNIRLRFGYIVCIIWN